MTRFEVLGPEGEQVQSDQGVNDFVITNAPAQTLPSIADDPDPLEGQDYVPAHTVAHNTVPGTDTRKLKTWGGQMCTLRISKTHAFKNVNILTKQNIKDSFKKTVLMKRCVLHITLKFIYGKVEYKYEC